MAATGRPTKGDQRESALIDAHQDPVRGDAPTTVAVVARWPASGSGKRRLAAGVGDDEAARIYGVLLDDTLRRIGGIAGIRPVVAWSDAPSGPPRDPLPARFTSRSQRGDGLGERLAALFTDLFADGAPAVILVGADSPALPQRFVIAAVDRLRAGDADIILGPAADGGFYLLGSTCEAWQTAGQALTAVLCAMPAGTPVAGEHVRSGASATGLRVGSLPLWVDVDDSGDVPVATRLMPTLRPTSGEAARASILPGSGCAERARGPAGARLREVYLHVTDRCDGTCPHCYVADDRGLQQGRELSTARWLEGADQAMALGATSFVIIGGDPFARADLLDLVGALTGERQARVRLFFSRALDYREVRDLTAAGHGRLTPLLSIDGTAAHEALRGSGTLAAALATAHTLLDAGLDPVVNTVLLRPVLPDLPGLVDTLARVGVRRLHLILPHRRGRLARLPELVPSGAELLAAVEVAAAAAQTAGLALDNQAAWLSRFGAPRDLCSAGCSLLAIDPYGRVSACPITCGDEAFLAGDLNTEDLESIFRRAPTLELLRHSHARDRLECRSCPVVDMCGGECWVQAHYAAVAEGRPAGYDAPFPYCGLVRPLLERVAADREGQEGGTVRKPGEPVREAGSRTETAGPGLGYRPPDYTPFDCI